MLVSYSLTIDPCVLHGVVYTRVVKSTDLVIILITKRSKYGTYSYSSNKRSSEYGIYSYSSSKKSSKHVKSFKCGQGVEHSNSFMSRRETN